ncbi:hypothetical protein ACFL0M_14680 [Thermodesulfobacteriota bacterium]
MNGERDNCSQVADFYYSQEDPKLGCDTDKIVFEMEKLCRQGQLTVSRSELKKIIRRKYPEMREGRVPEVIVWARKEGYIDEDRKNWIITIKRKG